MSLRFFLSEGVTMLNDYSKNVFSYKDQINMVKDLLSFLTRWSKNKN